MELKKDYVLDQVKKIRDSIESWRIKCKYNCQHSKRNHSLKIKYPRFSATAKINLPPLKKGECWEIGWVQGIEDQDFVMWYSNQGYYSFELPQLNKGNSFIIDSMGRKMPWYDDFIVKQGPTERKSSLEVVMHDQPTAEIPVRVGKGDLQWIYRRTKFRVWLVAKLAAKPTMHTLKMCTWLLETTVRKENNEWVKTVIQKDPINLEMEDIDLEVPVRALNSPTANDSVVLLRRLANGNAVILRPRGCSLTREEIDNRRFKMENGELVFKKPLVGS